MTTALMLRPDQRATVEAILRTHAPRPCRVWAFGSRARDSAKPYSDLDLAIDAGRPLTLAETGDLAWAFEDSDLPWRVDLLDLATCSDAFRREVEDHAVPVFGCKTRMERGGGSGRQN